jgi:hypothetical protein
VENTVAIHISGWECRILARSLKERFSVHFPFGSFDTLPVPRLSENAMWLLEQR